MPPCPAVEGGAGPGHRDSDRDWQSHVPGHHHWQFSNSKLIMTARPGARPGRDSGSESRAGPVARDAACAGLKNKRSSHDVLAVKQRRQCQPQAEWPVPTGQLVDSSVDLRPAELSRVTGPSQAGSLRVGTCRRPGRNLNFKSLKFNLKFKLKSAQPASESPGPTAAGGGCGPCAEPPRRRPRRRGLPAGTHWHRGGPSNEPPVT